MDRTTTKTYAALAGVAGVFVPIVGAVALAGGQYAGWFIRQQLREQNITMPDRETLDKEVKKGLIDQDNADHLLPFAGQPLLNGAAARRYADDYIAPHMSAGARFAKVPADKASFAGVGDLIDETRAALAQSIQAKQPEASEAEVTQLVRAELAKDDSEFDEVGRIAQLKKMRQENFLIGNLLRGVLLDAYGWWFLGRVGSIVGAAALAAGGPLMLVSRWLGRRSER